MPYYYVGFIGAASIMMRPCFYGIIYSMNRNKEKGYKGRAFNIIMFSIASMFVISIISLIILQYISKGFETTKTEELVEYDAHYVFIAETKEDDFWNEVYDKAYTKGISERAYVEYLARSLNVNYSSKDLFRVAINSGVDGIIYGGSVDDDTVKLINQAVDEGIGVVLLQSDADNSRRQCFVGVNNYELGQVYASQLAKMYKPEEFMGKRVRLLVNSGMSEGAINVITLAIEDYFTEKFPEYAIPEIEIIQVDTQDVFSAEEDIRNAMLDENLPDVTICLSSTFTQCAYQALIDLNKVGDTQILGYFANDAILDAVQKQIIYSTVSIDTNQMGSYAVAALKEYSTFGYTNSYVSVKTTVIDKYSAGRMINENVQ